MSLSIHIFENILVQQISPLEQSKLSRVCSQFYQNIMKVNKNQLRKFRSLNPWLYNIDDFEAKVLLHYNAKLIYYLTSYVKINDENYFSEFLFNSQDVFLSNIPQSELLKEEMDYEELFNDPNKNIQQKINQCNMKLYSLYNKPNYTDGRQIGHLKLLDKFNSNIYDLETKQINQESFIDSFCHCQSFRVFIDVFMRKILNNNNPYFHLHNDHNLVKIIVKCSIKTNYQQNIQIAQQIMRKFQNEKYNNNIFDKYELTQLYQYMLEKHSLSLLDYLNQLCISFTQMIPVIFQIFADNRNIQSENLQNIIEQQIKSELLSRKETYISRHNNIWNLFLDCLNFDINMIQIFVNVVERYLIYENGQIQVFYQIKLINNEIFNNFVLNNDVDNIKKCIQEFLDNQIHYIDAIQFLEKIKINHFSEYQNNQIEEFDQVTKQGQIGQNSSKIQNQLLFDLTCKDQQFDVPLEEYIVFHLVIDIIGVQLLLLFNRNKSVKSFQNIIRDIIFKHESINNNKIETVQNIENANKKLFEVAGQCTSAYPAINLMFNLKSNNIDNEFNQNSHILNIDLSIKMYNTIQDKPQNTNDASKFIEVKIQSIHENVWMKQINNPYFYNQINDKNNNTLSDYQILQKDIRNDKNRFDKYVKIQNDEEVEAQIDYEEYLSVFNTE